jgi:UDP-N-acetylglucosamine acyltransferase
MTIHPTAIVDPHAKIGRNVKIGPYVVVGPNVSIGDDSEILSHAVIEFTTMGQGCRIFPHVCLGLPAQHLGYKNEPASVRIGDNCTFREGVTVHRGTAFDKSITQIGNNGYFMALSHIAHDCIIGNNVIMANAAQLAGHVKVGNNCFISASVGVHQFTRIGQGALVSGGAMVPQDVAPFCIAQGDRAILRGLNVIGMRRAGLDKNSIRLVKEAFKTMFLSGFRLDEALSQPIFKENNEYLKIFHDFFLEPKRGYTRPNKSGGVEMGDENS